VIHPLDAWTMRRLLCVEAVNGEVQGVSRPFRSIADHLAALPPEARGPAWEAFLTGRHDRDEIIMVLSAADPLGLPPDAGMGEDGESADGWGPIRLGSMPGAEPFPVDVLPGPAALMVNEGADAIGCPPDFLALPVLAVAAGTIGRSVSLMLKSGYFAGSAVYGACVGPPSDGKTPALKAVAAAVRRIDELLIAEHDQAMERLREETERPGPDGKKLKPPAPPKLRRIDVDDITMEVIPAILDANERGLIRINDELTAFVLGMNQFKAGKGNDRAIALKIWSGDAIKKDRVGHENNAPIRCPYPCMTLVGGLPPDMLGSMADAKGRADGFLDRFLFAYPEPLPVADWSERGVPEDTADAWSALVARLWARPMNAKEGRAVPHVARFTPEGKAAWQERYDAHAAEMNEPGFDPALRGPWGKLREYAGRLTLILACLHHAADPTADPTGTPAVGPDIVVNAWRLVAYFKSHATRVHATIARGPGIGGGPVVKAVVDWLRKGNRKTFSEHDLKQARRWITDDNRAAALGYLTSRNAIRPRSEPAETPKEGRPPLPVYETNPALLVT